jgi:uridine kinase
MADDVSTERQLHRFVDLATWVRALPPSAGRSRLVAIDGPGGAGKSTFAERLAGALGAAPVVHTDDFASWDNQFEWWPRLQVEVIDPLRAQRPGRYQRYDWTARDLAEWHEVPVAPVVIVEGVGSGRRELTQVLAAIIWIETAAEVRLQRGIERDGEELREFWNQWIAGETAHYAKDGTRDRADVIVDGNPRQQPAEPNRQYVAFAGAHPRVGGATPQNSYSPTRTIQRSW